MFQKKSGWQDRKRGGDKVIGRMYTVSVSEGERYYLRLLLLHVPGATSFENLRTVHGVTFLTFKEACQELGLLEDDSVWEATLSDAVRVGMPKALRDLFAIICVFGCPLEPKKLWEKFLDHFTEDLAGRHINHNTECHDCENLALRDVQEVLILHGKNCVKFGLKSPPQDLPYNIDAAFDVLKEKAEGKNMVNSIYSFFQMFFPRWTRGKWKTPLI